MIQNETNSLRLLARISSVASFENIQEIEVINKATTQPIKVPLYKETDRSSAITVYALLKEENRIYILGRITVLVLNNLSLHSHRSIANIDISSKDQRFYLKHGQLRDTLWVEGLWCPGNTVFKYIGKQLLNWAKNYSQKGSCQGRLALEASLSSHGFYQKQGLKAMTGTRNFSAKKVDEIIEKYSPNTGFLGQVLMYLSNN